MTDTLRWVRWRGRYYPFGELYYEWVSQENMLRFPGQYEDDQTGHYYNWHRHYEPRLGRYLQPDPIGLAGGVHPYGYAQGNPVRFIDPKGLDCSPCTQTWAECYTNCINTLAPGFEEFFIGSQLIVNAPYTIDPVFLPDGGVSFDIYSPNVFSEWRPTMKLWGWADKASKVLWPLQALVFSWVAGASYGCMISCGLDECSY